MKDIAKDELDIAISQHRKNQNSHKLIPKSFRPRSNKTSISSNTTQSFKPQPKPKSNKTENFWEPSTKSTKSKRQPITQPEPSPVTNTNTKPKADMWGQPSKTFDYQQQKKPSALAPINSTNPSKPVSKPATATSHQTRNTPISILLINHSISIHHPFNLIYFQQYTITVKIRQYFSTVILC